MERCARGLNGFEKKFQVPKLMDPDDIVSVPGDKEMTLYLSYIVDVLQKKNPQKKTLVGSLKQAPDRRASAPNIAGNRATLGGGGYLPGAHPVNKTTTSPVTNGGTLKNSPSPARKPEASQQSGPPSWTKRKVPDMDAVNTSPSSSSSSPSSSSTNVPPPTIVIAPPVIMTSAPDNSDRVRDLEKKLEGKDHEIEALKEALRLLEGTLERKEREFREVEDRLNREVLAAKALASNGGGGGSGGEVKKAIDELKAQVEELEQHNQMLQMSLEDSRVSQRRMEEASKSSSSKPSFLSPKNVKDQKEEEELLRHQVRDAEKRATDAEQRLEELRSLGNAGGGGGSAREARLQKQVGELEDKIVALEQEGRQLKRAAEKAGRLEKEVAELEERESKSAQEVRDLKRQLRAAANSSGTNEEPTMERKKSNSKLLRSPREKTIPKFDLTK